MISVKICGINSPEAFDTAAEAGADYIGFVFFPPSPRYVTPSVAASLVQRLMQGPRRVGLFVEPTPDAIAQVVDTLPLDALQIYGAVHHLPEIKARTGLPIWQALGIASSADLPATAPHADALVLEAKPPAGATRPGGNAASFDWDILRDWRPLKSWLLAGGLTVENVGDAIHRTGARAVDVSSGVERSKGVKDPALIRAFVTAARQAAR